MLEMAAPKAYDVDESELLRLKRRPLCYWSDRGRGREEEEGQCREVERKVRLLSM